MKILANFEATVEDDKGNFTIISEIPPCFYTFLGSLNLSYISEVEKKEVKDNKPLDCPQTFSTKYFYRGRSLRLVNGYLTDYYIPAEKGTKIWVNFYKTSEASCQ